MDRRSRDVTRTRGLWRGWEKKEGREKSTRGDGTHRYRGRLGSGVPPTEGLGKIGSESGVVKRTWSVVTQTAEEEGRRGRRRRGRRSGGRKGDRRGGCGWVSTTAGERRRKTRV